MTLIDKKPRFIDNGAGDLETGGAPIFTSDIVRLQENARADIINAYEYYRAKLPPLLFYQGPSNPAIPFFENGIILSGCEYDNTSVSAPVISPGFILSGGEVCYYPGGTIPAGVVNQAVIYIWKGSETKESRVFNDGGSKEILTTFDVNVEQGIVTATGPELQAGSAITATDQVVAISCGNGSATYAESYFTVQSALGIQAIGFRLNKNPFVNAGSFVPEVALGSAMPFIASRVTPMLGTEIRGSVEVQPATFSAPEERLFTLTTHAIFTSINIGLFASYTDPTYGIPVVFIDNTGGVFLREPSGGWGILPATVQIVFNTEVFGANTAPVDDYTFESNFLDITP